MWFDDNEAWGKQKLRTRLQQKWIIRLFLLLNIEQPLKLYLCISSSHQNNNTNAWCWHIWIVTIGSILKIQSIRVTSQDRIVDEYVLINANFNSARIVTEVYQIPSNFSNCLLIWKPYVDDDDDDWPKCF